MLNCIGWIEWFMVCGLCTTFTFIQSHCWIVHLHFIEYCTLNLFQMNGSLEWVKSELSNHSINNVNITNFCIVRYFGGATKKILEKEWKPITRIICMIEFMFLLFFIYSKFGFQLQILNFTLNSNHFSLLRFFLSISFSNEKKIHILY